MVDKLELLRKAQEQIDQVLEYTTELERAARALVQKLDVVALDERYRAVWTLWHNHFGAYAGPQYALELGALREVLDDTQRKERALQTSTDNAELEALKDMVDDFRRQEESLRSLANALERESSCGDE